MDVLVSNLLFIWSSPHNLNNIFHPPLIFDTVLD